MTGGDFRCKGVLGGAEGSDGVNESRSKSHPVSAAIQQQARWQMLICRTPLSRARYTSTNPVHCEFVDVAQDVEGKNWGWLIVDKKDTDGTEGGGEVMCEEWR